MSNFGSDIFDDGDQPKTPSAADDTGADSATAADDAPTADAAAPAKKKTRRRRAAKPASDETEAAPTEAADAAGDDEPAAPPRKKRTRKKAAAKKAPAPEEDGSDTAPERDPASEPEPAAETETDAGPAEPRRRRRRARRGADTEEESPDVDATPEEAEDRGPDDATDEAPPERRSRRRRRSRRGGGNGDAGGGEKDEPRRGREDRKRKNKAGANAGQWTSRRSEFPTVPGQRLAVFLDLDRLVAESSEQDGEIAFTKLKATLGGKRNLIRAVAYGSEASTSLLDGPVKQAGFEPRLLHDAAELAVALAVDAMAIGPRVDCVVVAPGTDGLGPLAAALRGAGVRVETAGFGEPSQDADRNVVDHQELGAECMFVP